MNLLYGCVIALSMYSRIPMPRVEWKKERMEHVMCFFPLVGIAEGIALGAWLWLCGRLGLSELFAALWGTAIPILITGGIHMDGFLDTMDAIHSYGDRKKRLAIMKDPHTGAFAIISAVTYICLYAGAMGQYVHMARQRKGGLLFLWPVFYLAMERAFSGLGVLALPKAKQDGLAASFSRAARERTDKRVLILWIILLEAGAILAAKGWGAGFWPGFLGLVQLGIFLWYGKMVKREFGGVTGDLAGWFLQVCELGSLAASLILLA